jgi:hypothetical protein
MYRGALDQKDPPCYLAAISVGVKGKSALLANQDQSEPWATKMLS